MLMDNSGAAKGESSNEKSAAANPFEGGVVDNFGAFLSERPDLKPEGMEMPNMGVETSTSAEKNEAMSEALPPMAKPQPPVQDPVKKTDDAQADSPEMQALIDTPVPRDAERLPKAYMDNVVRIIEKNKKDPHQLVTDLDIARWDLMKKAFNRNRGDGK